MGRDDLFEEVQRPCPLQLEEALGEAQEMGHAFAPVVF